MHLRKNTNASGNLWPAIFIALLSTAFSSCKKENRWDMLKRTGEKTTEMRDVAPFTKIFLKDNVNVFIKQGTKQELTVEGGKNLVPLVRTEVINGELLIENDNRCNWARSYKNGVINVYLTITELGSLRHFGSGSAETTDTLACKSITVQTHESGDVKLTLTAEIIYIQMGGTSDITLSGASPLMGVFHLGEGYLHAENMATDITWTNSKASGNEYINAKKSISAKIEWAGSIYYTGDPPDVVSQITGSGKLISSN